MLIGDTRGTMAQHPVKVEASAGAGLLGKAPAMSALWLQAQEAEVTRLQAELDDALVLSGALESVQQLSETLEAARNQLRACYPEAVPPTKPLPAQAQPDGLAPATDFQSCHRAPVCSAAAVCTAGTGWAQLYTGSVEVAYAADCSPLGLHNVAAAAKTEGADCAAPACHAVIARTDARGGEGDCSADADMMTAAEKKKVMRAATKDLYAKLDALLPPTGRAHAFDADALGGQAPSSRGPGRSGRSLNEILHDAVHCVKMHHKRHGSTPGPKLRKGHRGPGRRAKKPVGAAPPGQRAVAELGASARMPPPSGAPPRSSLSLWAHGSLFAASEHTYTQTCGMGSAS
jgi:hypothetical protein